jgi:hypothetical protein
MNSDKAQTTEWNKEVKTVNERIHWRFFKN